MSFSRVAVVSGSNKGIGLAVVRHLALDYPKSHLNNGPFLIYLTARDKTRGEQALQILNEDSTLRKAKVLTQHGGLSEIKYHQLDISEPTSIHGLSEFLKTEHPQGIDILINNAGIAMTGFDLNVVQKTLQCNYHGTLNTTLSLLPLLKKKKTPPSRIINLSSIVGSLSGKYSPSLQESFRSATTIPQITALMDQFTTAVRDGVEKEQGFPSAAYAVSKAGITGMTRVLAKQLQEEGEDVLVYACCPGYVQTDMTKGGGAKTVDEGARTPVMLALGEIGGRTGEFWRDEKVREW